MRTEAAQHDEHEQHGRGRHQRRARERAGARRGAEPRAWLSFELASAVGFEPAFARSTDRSVRVAGLIDGQGIGLSALENERMTPVVMGWFGAAIGPPIARLALRVHGNVGDFGGRGGALIGAEAAMVFGLPVNLPRAPRAR